MGFLSSIVDAVASAADEVGGSIGDVITEVEGVYDEVAVTIEAVADGDVDAIISVVTTGATILGGALGGPVGASLGNAAGNLLGAAVGEGSWDDAFAGGLTTLGAAIGGPAGSAVASTLGGFVTGATDLSDFGLDDLAGVAVPAVTQLWGDDIAETLTEWGGDELQDVLGASGSMLDGVSTIEDLTGLDLSSITGPLDDLRGGASALGLGSGDDEWGASWSQEANDLLAETFGDDAGELRELLDKFDIDDIDELVPAGILDEELSDTLGGLASDVLDDQLSGFADDVTDELDELLGSGSDDSSATADTDDSWSLDGDDVNTGIVPNFDSVTSVDAGGFDAPDNGASNTMPLDAMPLDAMPLDAMPLDAMPLDAPLDTQSFDAPSVEVAPEPAYEPEPEPVTAVAQAVEVADTVEATTDSFFEDL